LALALIHALGTPPARILDVGTGSGRNARALRAAGHHVDALDESAVAYELPSLCDGNYDAIISTHAFLHGNSAGASQNIAAAHAALSASGLFYATFASVRDARFGAGTQVDAQSFAPLDGDEAGIAHVYFNAGQLRALLQPHFEITSMDEHAVDAIVGRWAHVEQPAGSVHWFVQARAKGQ